ncbi:hypothetical protein H8356DRAFT_1403417 [Neocallimastix lanati (nom. inval.)]|uniref:Uncharacterized protein n=1 Tax=Neocallimastix californiae TaxID=1754190 RepID=A0A1Y2C1D0_9FUNG|nr:hypothetical protein H8356DRAFT_1403416 [Neocallimastix sp. JGI-2020a]KAG4093247.1 hypothetical protein H8356DRAFT_1403417 [Neocallimastix sp. JGI-2020a]ORY40843.1 hypothetical protein LY90DRAFT_510296 [Neocallimastix californiae]ORY40845.1 hypothetical protein LY90DRAFT_510300 [Neocallimastix californiae]|eukprot:ORY40843.1 hypothetical protein LY90DRAFT_510296 [Neocallimastix californiae]
MSRRLFNSYFENFDLHYSSFERNLEVSVDHIKEILDIKLEILTLENNNENYYEIKKQLTRKMSLLNMENTRHILNIKKDLELWYDCLEDFQERLDYEANILKNPRVNYPRFIARKNRINEEINEIKTICNNYE